MEIKEYFKVIVKRAWIIMLLLLVSGGTAAYINFKVLAPVYEASTTLYVINKNIDNRSVLVRDDILVSSLLVSDYRELIKSRTITSSVIEQLGLKEVEPEELAKKITVDEKNETRIIEVKVRNSDPQLARDIANKVGEVFISKAVELMKVENISVVDKAQTPLKPILPRTYVNISVTMLTALIIAIGIIFLLEYLDDDIKTVEDVEKRLNLVVLGTIPVIDMN